MYEFMRIAQRENRISGMSMRNTEKFRLFPCFTVEFINQIGLYCLSSIVLEVSNEVEN